MLKLMYTTFFFFSINLLISHQFDTLPLGVAPELAPLYSKETFQCFDKSNTISFNRVNDNYCDCKDSSDEPGTSACQNSKFYCLNTGYLPKSIYGNFVNDGFCDCCDGSDEYLSKNCTNTCSEMAAHLDLEKNRLTESFSKGYEIYKHFQENIDVKLQNKKEEDYKKFVEKRLAEKQRRAEEKQEEIRKKLEEEEKAKKEAEETNSEPSSEDEFDPEKEAERQLNDEDLAPPPSEEEVTKPQETADDEEEEDMTHAMPAQLDYGPNNSFLMLAENDPVDCYELSHEEYIYKVCPFNNVYQIPKQGGSQTTLGNWGKWLVREHSGAQPLVMLYENGTPCWQGPSRSAKVKITCGSENKLTSATEPSRCEYVINMESPAACYLPPHELLEGLKHDHDEL